MVNLREEEELAARAAATSPVPLKPHLAQLAFVYFLRRAVEDPSCSIFDVAADFARGCIAQSFCNLPWAGERIWETNADAEVAWPELLRLLASTVEPSPEKAPSRMEPTR